MDSTCFICKSIYANLDELFAHLKYVHLLTSNSMYRCGILHCPQSFTSFCSFAKHMKSNICYTYSSQRTLNNKNNMVYDIPPPEINSNIQFEGNEQNINDVDIDTLKYSMLKFSLHYYGKFNFSRKEALEI